MARSGQVPYSILPNRSRVARSALRLAQSVNRVASQLNALPCSTHELVRRGRYVLQSNRKNNATFSCDFRDSFRCECKSSSTSIAFRRF